MLKKLKTIFILLPGLCLFHSCVTSGDSSSYTEMYAVIRSNVGAVYFTTDNGLTLIPDQFDPTWGEDGDRVYIGFNYTPVVEGTTKLNITLQTLEHLLTDKALSPLSADTVGTGQFYHDESVGRTTFAWLAQNFMTVHFYVKYTSGAKHKFGFIEEPKLYSNNLDTMFLKLWHNTYEPGETVGDTHIALDLKYYEGLTVHDSAVISVKYDVVYPSGEIGEKTGYVTYRRKDHLQ